MSTATVIDAQLVKTLREKTNAGLMECKRALAETNGDLEAAIDVLRKKGAASAAKKADREAKEGVIAQAILPGAKVGVLVEINCETDFVAKNDSFNAFTDEIAKKIASEPGADLEPDRVAAVQKIGENVLHPPQRPRRSDRPRRSSPPTSTPAAKSACSSKSARRRTRPRTSEDFKQLVRDITLQIAAANPDQRRSQRRCPRRLVEREREIYRGPGASRQTGEHHREDRRWERWTNSTAASCLIDQAFIKNPDQTIANCSRTKSKALGENLSIRRFIRYMVGEELPSTAA